jgi:Xaa-Pro aminopeptidase
VQQYIREQIDWPQPFPPEEYAERRARVRKALAAKDIAAIYVTTPANLTWLTGYDMIWYHSGNLTGLLLRADRDDTVFFDYHTHSTILSTTPEIGRVVWLDYAPAAAAIETIAKTIAEAGLANARIAIEPGGYSPDAAIMQALGKRLAEQGKPAAEPHLVEELRLVKSPNEIAVVRQAALIAEAAMGAARDAIGVGVMETEIEAALMQSLMKAGGGYPGIRSMIGSGPRAGTHHSAPQHRKIKAGDLVFIDFCASLHRYHVNLNRTFSLGEPDRRWTDLMDRSAGCIDAICAGIRIGDPWSKVATLGKRYVEEAGLQKYVWWVGGYALGIAVPPDWCGAYWVEPHDGLPDRPIEPGMVFNFENQFDVWEDWPGGSGAAWIDTLLATEAGLQPLSKLPRTLVTV